MSLIDSGVENSGTSLPIIRRDDFAVRTIHAPHFLAETLRERLRTTYAQFSIVTIDEDEIHVSPDVYDLAAPLRSDDDEYHAKPR